MPPAPLHVSLVRRAGLLLAVAVAALLGGRAAAQPMARVTGLPTQQTLQHWTKRDGLPQNSVLSLARTPDGYVWIGTLEGLVRFDGRAFTSFHPKNTPGLSSGQINVLRTVRNGRLWIGTNTGLTWWYDGTFGPALRLPTHDPDVQDIAEAPDGSLWIAAIGGLFRFDGRTFEKIGPSAGLTDIRALSLAFGRTGTLYVGTPTGLFAGRNGRFAPLGNPEVLGLVRALFAAPNGTVYVGSTSGLMHLDASGQPVPVAMPSDPACAPVRGIALDPSGVLWTGTRSQGVCTVVDGELVRVAPEQGMPTGDTRAFLTDPEHGFWIGGTNGVIRLRRGRFATLGTPEGLPGHGGSVVMHDARARLWVGTQGGGLARYSPEGVRLYGYAQGLPELTVTALAEHQGSVWAGVNDGDASGGLCRLTSDEAAFSCIRHPFGSDLDFVFALLSTGRTLWAGTRQGLAQFDGTRLAVIPDSVAGLHGQIVTSLVNTPDGSVWAGANGGGIVRFPGGDRSRPRPYTTDDGLPSMAVVVLHTDEHGAIWAGMLSGEVCRFAPGRDRWRCIGAREGLSGGQIMQLLSDQRGFLWVGTNFGFERFRIADFDRFERQQLSAVPVEAMGMSEYAGLRDPEAIGGIQPSAWRLPNGKLAFATVAGLALFEGDESVYFANRVPPPVHIVQARSAHVRIPTDSRVHRLPVGERDLHVLLSIVTFTQPTHVQIRYRLEGYDDEWQTLPGDGRSLSYTSLPPGTYRLHVQAANADGVWNRDGAVLRVEMPARFFETGWFRAILILGALMGLVHLVRWRLHSLVLRQQELEQTVVDRTAALQKSQDELMARERELEAVNEGLEAEVKRQVEDRMLERRRYEEELIDARDKAEASARLKETILNNMSHEIRTPITAILGFAEVLEHEVEGDAVEFVHYIDENGKRLLTTLNTVLDFSYLESEGMNLQPTPFDALPLLDRAVRTFEPLARRHGLDVAVDAPESLAVTTDFFGFERILTNLIGNAVKFTPKGSVRVSLDATDDRLTLVVSDTGLGISPEFLPDLYTPFKQESGGLARQHEGTGLGLTIVKRFVDALGGTIACETEKDKGTTFTVVLPRHLAVSGDGVSSAAPVAAKAG